MFELLKNSPTECILAVTFYTADNQLNAKPRLSKDVRMQHFRFHKEDAINVYTVYLFQIYRWIFIYTESKSKI